MIWVRELDLGTLGNPPTVPLFASSGPLPDPTTAARSIDVRKSTLAARKETIDGRMGTVDGVIGTVSGVIGTVGGYQA